MCTTLLLFLFLIYLFFQIYIYIMHEYEPSSDTENDLTSNIKFSVS